MPSKRGLSKKEINRFKKAELMKIVRAEGLPCNTKMLKRDLVDCVFKHKKLRGSLQAPPKREMSEKQKANLSRFRLGKDFKNEKKIKPKAQKNADQNQIEDTNVLKEKIQPRYKEIGQNNSNVKKAEKNLKKLDRVSNFKIDDNVKLRYMGSHQKANKKRLQNARNKAMGKREEGIGAQIPEELQAGEVPGDTGKDNIKKLLEELKKKKNQAESGQAEEEGDEEEEKNDEVIEDDDEEEETELLENTADISAWEDFTQSMGREQVENEFDALTRNQRNRLLFSSLIERATSRNTQKGFINPRNRRFVSGGSDEFRDLMRRLGESLSLAQKERLEEEYAFKFGASQKKKR